MALDRPSPCSDWLRPAVAGAAMAAVAPRVTHAVARFVGACTARSRRSFWILGLGASAIALGSLAARAADCPPRRTELPTLSQGDNGQDVRRLQGILTLLGFYQGTADGQYDAALTSAVRSFQQALNLEPSGTVNAETWAQLLPSPACNPRPPATTPDP
ncbi:MAG TPA: peptidoglycan-binding domain-containing protein [Coleofasciculaceae cyanobacterium]